MITADMTREEAENALSDYRQDNSRIAQSSAHRRRVVLALHQRNGWKALGYETPERFAQAELSLGRRAYFAIIERAKTEQQIITALPDFAKENVKDWVLTVLQEYAAADQQQIAAQLLQARSAARRGLHDRGLPSIKGKQITDTAERLGIVPLVEKAKSNTDTALLFAPKPPPANDITPTRRNCTVKRQTFFGRFEPNLPTVSVKRQHPQKRSGGFSECTRHRPKRPQMQNLII